MMAKHFFDFIIALLLLLLLSPVLFIVALMIRFVIGYPVIFRQERPGLKGRSFYLFKFRTMSDVFDRNGNCLPDELRMTKLGACLRRFSLDELPQLYNVLKGDMSLVGPRPLLMEYMPLYTPEQIRRHEVRPGITGWAQVNGRNAISWEDKLRLDTWYVDNRSLWLDIKILCVTVLRVLSKSGISQDGHVTMEKFRGTNFPEAGR